ncbi:MAG: bifunctional ADP-dependent (S)-NAD(P)H-hydrate dehydratase/NAD(P)H-hydrate epimerase, partial [Cellulomonadaceae bacterium]
MIEAFGQGPVREAEASALASGAPLMQRAAFGVAGYVLRVLRERSGAVPGSRVVVLAGLLRRVGHPGGV